jgi:hypothetical protein
MMNSGLEAILIDILFPFSCANFTI